VSVKIGSLDQMSSSALRCDSFATQSNLALPFLGLLLLIASSDLLIPVASQPSSCSYSGPYPWPTLLFSLLITNTSIDSLPPYYTIQFIASLDADLQSSSLAPTASTIPDIQCFAMNPSDQSVDDLNLTLLILGSLTVDTGVDPIDAMTQLITDIHNDTFQSNSNYDLNPDQHIAVFQLCPDGVTLIPIDQQADCGSSGGLSVGIQVCIAMLVLTVASLAIGVIAWKWMVRKEALDKAMGRHKPQYG